MPTRLILVLALTAGLFACSERPQRLHVSAERAEAQDQSAAVDQQRQRTLHQSEAGRIYNEAILR